MGVEQKMPLGPQLCLILTFLEKLCSINIYMSTENIMKKIYIWQKLFVKKFLNDAKLK